MGAGLGLLTKNRPSRENGTAYGGVAVVWKEGSGVFKEVAFKNPESYEVLVAAGSLRGEIEEAGSGGLLLAAELSEAEGRRCH